MKNRVVITFVLILVTGGLLMAQSVGGVSGNQSCAGGGEMWVCGSAQQSQAHSDYDANCGEYTFPLCTLIRTVVDVCSPDLRESYIIEGNPEACGY